VSRRAGPRRVTASAGPSAGTRTRLQRRREGAPVEPEHHARCPAVFRRPISAQGAPYPRIQPTNTAPHALPGAGSQTRFSSPRQAAGSHPSRLRHFSLLGLGVSPNCEYRNAISSTC
jgi:hypothetical protein